jgi:hypothetical protein
MTVIEVATGKKKRITVAEFMAQWAKDGTSWKYKEIKKV